MIAGLEAILQVKLPVTDPDGTVLRFYYYTGPTDRFTGVELRDGEVVQFYQTPRFSKLLTGRVT